MKLQSEFKQDPPVQSRFTPELQTIFKENPTLLVLIHSLQLEEV